MTLEQNLVALAQAIGADVKTLTQQSSQVGPTGPMGPSGKNGILSITKLTSSDLTTFTIPTGSSFYPININSDSTNRFAKTVFTAPSGGSVLLEIQFNLTIVTNETRIQIGISQNSTQKSNPEMWCTLNGEDDYSSSQYTSRFILTDLTPNQQYTYYFMTTADISGAQIRCKNYTSSSYSNTDQVSPLLIFAYDLGDSQLLSNPSN